MADLESQDTAQTARRYDAELQSMKQRLQQERHKLETQLLQEKRAREAAEQQLQQQVAGLPGLAAGQLSEQSYGQLGSPVKGMTKQAQQTLSPKRKGRENASPNKPRVTGVASLQDSVLLKAQLQQAKETAELTAQQSKAALEAEQEKSKRLQQQLWQLQDSDRSVMLPPCTSLLT